MAGTHREYRYIGPAELRSLVVDGAPGPAVRSMADLGDWLAGRPASELDDAFTYVVDAAGVLRIAPRRSEHVVCAGGGPVVGAGEIRFAPHQNHWRAVEISNQSTGYCPDTGSWPAVAEALDRAGIAHPGGFTVAIVFRRCPDPACGELAVVKDADYVCVFCDTALPEHWNLDEATPPETTAPQTASPETTPSKPTSRETTPPKTTP